MAFSYAVIHKDMDGWQVGVNDFAQTHEVTVKSLEEAMKALRRLIDQVQTKEKA